MIPRAIRIRRHTRFVGGHTIRWWWRGHRYAYAILHRDETLDGPYNGTRHPRWTGGQSWRTRHGLVAKCRYAESRP